MARVLGIDTATWTAAVGVATPAGVVAERRARAGRSHVGHLPALVEAVLRDAGLALAEVDAVAVSAGPGSFTGLRIGIAFAKGLAFAGHLPIVGVATLEAHAAAVGVPVGTLVCVANDARKGETYAALFRRGPGDQLDRVWDDAVWRPAALLQALPDDARLAGDAPAIFASEPGARACEPLVPSGGAVARLGLRALDAGAIAPLGAFEPTYIRAPDAVLPSPPLR